MEETNDTSDIESFTKNMNLICINYNLCSPFKRDIRCASLRGVEFVVTKERREKRAQRESCLKRV